MHLLVVGPTLIPTDGMIFAGTKYLLNQVEITTFEYQKWIERSNDPIMVHNEPTHILVLGTPWIWDKCWQSAKYKSLMQLFDRFPKARRLFFGIGSCFPLFKEEVILNDILSNIDELSVFEGAKIVTRDVLATKALAKFNPVLLPCPAYYALKNVSPLGASRDTIIWYDPTIGISKVDYNPDSERLKFYLNVFKSLYNPSRHSVYCVLEEETVLAMEIGLPKPIVIRDWNHAAAIMVSSKSIISGRVHLAVPAYELCENISLFAVDSRATVLYDVVNKHIMSPNDALIKYKSILLDFILNIDHI